jgi:TonB family protein
MYFELEDFRPDTPRAPRVISVREGVLLSIIVHLVAVVAILLAPKWLFTSAVQLVTGNPEPIRFVSIAPREDRAAPPKPAADQSDKDRQSATVEAPKPENAMPFSKGDTPDKSEGARAERAAGPDTPKPAPSSANATPPDVNARLLPDAPVVAKPATGGALGDQLRNLKKYLQNSNFDNDRGGQTNKAPDIQFDSKGVDFGPWIARFRAQVMSNWMVPATAEFLRGHVVLQFWVHRDGSITELKVLQESTVESFTSAAFNAMKTTMQQRTQPLPLDYPADQVLFTVTFFYNERTP